MGAALRLETENWANFSQKSADIVPLFQKTEVFRRHHERNNMVHKPGKILTQYYARHEVDCATQEQNQSPELGEYASKKTSTFGETPGSEEKHEDNPAQLPADQSIASRTADQRFQILLHHRI